MQERNKAVKDLEQSLLELHQIFLDMAVLVEAQVGWGKGAGREGRSGGTGPGGTPFNYCAFEALRSIWP